MRPSGSVAASATRDHLPAVPAEVVRWPHAGTGL